MRYKVGDSVRIKTWEQMEGEFGTIPYGFPIEFRENSININYKITWTESNEKELMEVNADRLLTIGEEHEVFDYIVEELLVWEPILDRLEILDL